MAAPKHFILLFLVAVSSISSASATIRLHLYFSEVLNGPNQSSFVVATPNIASGFGTIRVSDDALTESTAASAAIVGRVQGISVVASLDGTTFETVQTFVLTAGPYSGSTLTVVGRVNTADAVVERPIVGGTGQFRLAKGYVLSKLVSATASGVTLENDLFVLF